MLGFLTKAPQSRRTLFFGSVTHVWSDLYFALLVPLLPAIRDDMKLSYTEVVLLKSVFSGATAVLQVPAGIMAETMGEFWLLILGNIWVGVGLAAMALSPVFVVLLAVSFLGGLGGGTQHPLASSMVSRAYDDRGRSTAVGTVNFAGDLGKMAAPAAVVTVAIFHDDWRTTLWVVGVAGVVFMLLAMMTRRSVDIGKPRKEAASAADGIDGMKMEAFVKLSGVGILDTAARTGALVFLPFVLDDKGMGTAQISGMVFLLFVGGAAGKFVCGWLGDRYGLIAVIIGTKGLTAALLVVSLAMPPLALAPLMVVLGFGLNGTSSALYATVAEFVPARRRARLYGFYYTTNEGGTVLAPLIYGLIADLSGIRTTMVVMSLATMAILPASLTLKKHLEPRVEAAPGGDA